MSVAAVLRAAGRRINGIRQAVAEMEQMPFHVEPPLVLPMEKGL